jgi:cytidylate kinase
MTILALIGSTCSGKTTLGRAISSSLELPFRSCGDTIREFARHKGVAIGDLTAADHAEVDAQSRDWCGQEGIVVIEGRFLDQVLHGPQGVCHMVKLEAEVSVRAGRLSERSGTNHTSEDVARFDEEDRRFRVTAYGSTPRRVVNEVLVTSSMSVDESVERVLSWWNDLELRRD